MQPLRFLTLAWIVSLMSCGGGGGGSDPSQPQPQPPTPERRASNTTCLAPTSANLETSGLQIERAFPALPAISRLVGIVQTQVQPQGRNQHWYAISQNGQVYRFANDPAANSLELVLDLESTTYSTANEAGLLGIALHPNYTDNGWIFLYYMPTQSSARLSRFTRNTSGSAFEPSSEKIILEVGQPARNHNGGGLGFGPDGFLYLSLGDGGAANDLFGHGQNTNTLLAAMLRIDIDVENDAVPYTIPSDNPFANGVNGRPEIFAHGLRNPWRWSFDSLTGDLWLGDVGQNAIEEINTITNGANYGWPITEGNSCFSDNSCDMQGLTSPVIDYRHADTGGCSVTGGYVYRGDDINALRGSYLFADYCNGAIYGLEPTEQSPARQDLLETSLSISAFAQDGDGELYVLSLNGGAGGGVYKLVSSNPTNEASAIPELLSDTGCFSDTANQTPASGVMPYPVNSQLWSDGASKNRFFAIPDNTRIAVSDDGDFGFPERSVLIKSFFHQDSPVETRLLMKHDNGWAGYSYAWNSQRTEAILLNEGTRTTVDGSYTHIFPSRSNCLQCHLPAAGFSLGLETSQLNQIYPPSDDPPSNYLEKLETLGYFENSLSNAQKQERYYALDDDSASIELRARSYLHSNCAGCHRPQGPIAGMDLRYSTALADMGICNVAPQYGDLGIFGAQLLAPGDASNSITTLRMQTLDEDRMPPLSSDVVHSSAVGIVNAWINGLESCGT